MKNLRKNSGITLIALIVTIIVLLILAGVSLRLIAGGDGIMNRASNAVDKNEIETGKERVELFFADKVLEYYKERYVNNNESYADARAYILKDGKVEEDIKDYYLEISDTEYTENDNPKVKLSRYKNSEKGITLAEGELSVTGEIIWEPEDGSSSNGQSGQSEQGGQSGSNTEDNYGGLNVSEFLKPEIFTYAVLNEEAKTVEVTGYDLDWLYDYYKSNAYNPSEKETNLSGSYEKINVEAVDSGWVNEVTLDVDENNKLDGSKTNFNLTWFAVSGYIPDFINNLVIPDEVKLDQNKKYDSNGETYIVKKCNIGSVLASGSAFQGGAYDDGVNIISDPLGPTNLMIPDSVDLLELPDEYGGGLPCLHVVRCPEKFLETLYTDDYDTFIMMEGAYFYSEAFPTVYFNCNWKFRRWFT